MRAEHGLEEALREIVDKIDAAVRGTGYAGEPIKMVLAGGLAVHFYTRIRHTHDVDASFSKRLHLPHRDLVASFVAAL